MLMLLLLLSLLMVLLLPLPVLWPMLQEPLPVPWLLVNRSASMLACLHKIDSNHGMERKLPSPPC